jgi:hypothetical protein
LIPARQHEKSFDLWCGFSNRPQQGTLAEGVEATVKARNLSHTAASLLLGILAVGSLAAAPPAQISDGEDSLLGVPAETSPIPLSADAAVAPVVAAAKPLAWEPLTGAERWRYYWKDTFASPFIVPRTGFPALIRHLRNEPEDWGQGVSAYSVRLADRYGRFFLRQSVESAGAALLGHDPRYIPSGRSGVGGRVLHALTSAFLTRDQAGRLVPHWSRYGAIVTAEYLGNAWMPPGYRTTAEAWRGIGVQFGITASFNLVREFLPGRGGGAAGKD